MTRRSRPVKPSTDPRVIADRTCACGRLCASRSGRRTHERACPVERARSAAFVEAIEHGLDRAGLDRHVEAALAAARAGQPAPTLGAHPGSASVPGRLSTCDTCGGTIKRCEGTGWWHMTGTDHGHRATPNDSAVAGPGIGDNGCEWCTGTPDECDDECDCPTCEGERALDDDADAYFDRCRD